MIERARHRRRIEEEKKESSKKKKNRLIRIAIEVIVAMIAVLIIGYCIFDRVMDGKTMGCKISVYDVNVTWMNVEKAADKLIEEFQKTEVVFKENDKTEYKVSLKDAGFSLDRAALINELEIIKEKREPCKVLLEKKKNYTVPYQVIWDDNIMKSAFSSEHLGDAAARIKSTDAYIQFNEESRRYELIPSVLGTVIDNGKLLNHIQETLYSNFQDKLIKNSINVTVDTSVYQEAAITEKQTAINEKLAELNKKIEGYEKAEVTYTFGSEKELLDKATIQNWVKVEKDEISLDEAAMRDYIYNLGLEYNTQYVPRHFTTSYGNDVVIENNEYGYWIDENGEYEQLCKDLESGQPVSREPIYKAAGIGREGNDDLVEGYVEVDLTSQHLWLYYKGECKLDSPIVSGQPVGINSKTGAQEDWSTYLGSYPIAYTEHPATLSSDIYGYEVEVQYWMPFVYGQGLHDAGWRGAFGGEIYKTDGSHGCVNLPTDVAAAIYDYVDTGFPVIIYQ